MNPIKCLMMRVLFQKVCTGSFLEKISHDPNANVLDHMSFCIWCCNVAKIQHMLFIFQTSCRIFCLEFSVRIAFYHFKVKSQPPVLLNGGQSLSNVSFIVKTVFWSQHSSVCHTSTDGQILLEFYISVLTNPTINSENAAYQVKSVVTSTVIQVVWFTSDDSFPIWILTNIQLTGKIIIEVKLCLNDGNRITKIVPIPIRNHQITKQW